MPWSQNDWRNPKAAIKTCSQNVQRWGNMQQENPETLEICTKHAQNMCMSFFFGPKKVCNMREICGKCPKYVRHISPSPVTPPTTISNTQSRTTRLQRGTVIACLGSGSGLGLGFWTGWGSSLVLRTKRIHPHHLDFHCQIHLVKIGYRDLSYNPKMAHPSHCKRP